MADNSRPAIAPLAGHELPETSLNPPVGPTGRSGLVGWRGGSRDQRR